MKVLQKYFPHLTSVQLAQFDKLLPLYSEWNEKINVISRKDLDNFYERHVLHSLSIAKVFSFTENEIIMDIGTGGGFPGIPLAIFFPALNFILVDSIAKKIQVVNEVVKALQLKNVITKVARAETVNDKADYIVTRAVAKASDLIYWSKGKQAKKIIALKGGDLKDEFKDIRKNIRITRLKGIFDEDFFETKVIVEINL